MKKVLITGAGSYVGTSLADALAKHPEEWAVQTISVKGEAWKQESFAGYDALVHVAGIAHQPETEQNAQSYYLVNRDLAIRVAEKAKAEGVKQFVFMSSMSVYGMSCGRITAETKETPNTHYGQSKLMAEQGIKALASEAFQVAVLRPPMIYGKGCPGNYARLSAMLQKLPAFPKVTNERSMLYIECLCAFVRELLKSGEGGLFFPQNHAYVSTDELAKQIAAAHGKKLWQPAGVAWLIHALSPHVSVLGKLFGSLTYDHAMSQAFQAKAQPSFAETIRRTEAC